MPVTRNGLPKTGGNIVPIANATNTFQVMRQDGTTAVLTVDTANQRVGFGTGTPNSTLSLGATLSNTKIALFDDNAGHIYGMGVQGGQLRFHTDTSTNKFSFFTSAAGTEVMTLLCTGALGINATVPNSALQVGGPIATAIIAKTSAYTLTGSDSTVTGDTTTAAFTLTLPTAVGIAGRVYILKRTSASANNLTVGTTSSQTIDGATTKTLGSQYSAVTVQSDGTNWQIITTMGTVT